jgi:hypothetical protein
MESGPESGSLKSRVLKGINEEQNAETKTNWYSIPSSMLWKAL